MELNVESIEKRHERRLEINEPNHHFETVEFRINAWSEETDYRSVAAGILKAYVLPYSVYSELSPECVFDVFDAHDGDAHSIHHELSNTHTEAQLDELELFERDIVYIESVFVNPCFQGNGIGQRLLEETINALTAEFNPCFVLRAAPIKPEKETSDDPFMLEKHFDWQIVTGDEELKLKKKLINWYEKNGFGRVDENGDDNVLYFMPDEDC